MLQQIITSSGLFSGVMLAQGDTLVQRLALSLHSKKILRLPNVNWDWLQPPQDHQRISGIVNGCMDEMLAQKNLTWLLSP